MKMLDRLVRPPAERRSWGFDPTFFDALSPFTWSNSNATMTDRSFVGLVNNVHRTNGVVAAAVAARAAMVSQVRHRYRRGYSQVKTGELWGDRTLAPFEGPTRPTHLARLEMDVCYAGNAYEVLDDDGSLRRLVPDRVSFIMQSDMFPQWTGADGVQTIPPDARVRGIAYHAERHGEIVQTFPVGQYAHWMPEPDPVYWWRGESWVTSVLREIHADGQAVEHTSKFFDHAATPNLVFTFPPERDVEEIRAFAEVANATHAGTRNAWKNMFLAGGADVTQVGSDLSGLSLKEVVGGFETRVAARARIPGVVLGIREGYGGSSLNTGNYGAARRLWADGWFAGHADSLCAAREALVPPPGGSELSYDRDRILFLQEDQKDAAEIQQTQAVTMRQLVEAGYDPQSVTDAVTTGDMTKLRHTGNVSVQLQPPGSGGNNDD